MTDPLDILHHHGEQLMAYFGEVFSRHHAAPARLIESMRYSLDAGGKRLRPALVFETFRACNGATSRERSSRAAAAALELIHTFSLVHDDLPAMDNDDLRRGKPTNHKVFGDAMAILAGDAMVMLAFEIIATDANAAIAPALTFELARASGPLGMIGGQVLDMEGEKKSLSLDELRQMHRGKTGALLTCAARMGAICAGADEKILRAVTGFGQHVGLAFQIVDDVLDETSTSAQLGKAVKKDRDRGKNTYPRLLGLDESRRQAAEQLQLAMESLSPLGARADTLKQLARFVVERSM